MDWRNKTTDQLIEESKNWSKEAKEQIMKEMMESAHSRKTPAEWSIYWRSLAARAQDDLDRLKRLNGIE